MQRLFVLSDFGPEPLEVIARWLDRAESIERLTALFRAAAEVPGVDVKFLFLIQSVEGLHRALDDHPGIAANEFEQGDAAMKRAIPTELSKEAKRFLVDRVPRHNEPSLNSRLREYATRVTKVLPTALAKFAKDRQAIKNLRDEFSHALRGENRRLVEEHARAILYYCELLRLLFEFNLLHHLELDATQLERIFHQRFEELARQRSELLPKG